MAQPLATLARPYAQALFEALGSVPAPSSVSVASGAGAVTAASSWLEELAVVAQDPDLQAFSHRPGVELGAVFSLMTQVLAHALPPVGIALLRLLIENKRLGLVPEIVTQFRALQNAAQGVADAVVYSAFELDNGGLEKLRPGLEKHFACRLNLSQRVDPELIGGVRVVVGDEVLDTSVKARLQQMQSSLAVPGL